jgi:plasmid stabilization system protein ParE
MKRKIQVKEQAAEQLTDAFLWYEKQKGNLGFEFLEEWESVAEYLSDYSEGCTKKYKEFRQAMLKRFPYLVIYEIENDSVIIYNVINVKRHPLKRYKKRNKKR